MNTKKIEFSNGNIVLIKDDQTKESLPLDWFPKLKNATIEQLNQFELSAYGIHWENIDEDLSFDGFSTFLPKI